MTVNNAVNVMAGAFITVCLILAHVTGQVDMTHVSWLWAIAFIGLNLFQMGFTGFCPAKMVFKAMGLKDSDSNSGSCCS